MRREHAFILFACLAVCVAVALSGPRSGSRPASLLLAAPHGRHSRQRRRNRQAQQQADRFPALLRHQWRLLPEGAQAAARQHESLDGGKKGFLFNAERDGDYEFAVQFVYSDGTANRGPMN